MHYASIAVIKRNPHRLSRFWLGNFHYQSVPESLDSMAVFRERVTRLWRLTMRDRSQTHRVAWSRMRHLAVRWLISRTRSARILRIALP